MSSEKEKELARETRTPSSLVACMETHGGSYFGYEQSDVDTRPSSHLKLNSKDKFQNLTLLFIYL